MFDDPAKTERGLSGKFSYNPDFTPSDHHLLHSLQKSLNGVNSSSIEDCKTQFFTQNTSQTFKNFKMLSNKMAHSWLNSLLKIYVKKFYNF